MAHVVTAVEGPQIWYDAFLYDLENRQYTYRGTSGLVGIIGPNIREIHLLDITVPEQNLPDLLSDLAPYVDARTSQKKSALFVQKGLWLAGKLSNFFKGVKLKTVPNAKASGNVRRRALNIMPLFWFEDPECLDGDAILPLKNGKDGRGELL
jgi:hypothetical protein